jgi:hypothetical protein
MIEGVRDGIDGRVIEGSRGVGNGEIIRRLREP